MAIPATLIVASLAGSSYVKSPAQIAAETAPPTPTVVTAEVVRQTVTDTLVLRAKVTEQAVYSATPAGEQGAQTLVVTGIDKPAGSQLVSGDVIAEVSGRPLFVLQGSTPAYRDIAPGDTGKDVAELQAALQALGFSDVDPPGTFGSATKTSVQAFYARIGYRRYRVA